MPQATPTTFAAPVQRRRAMADERGQAVVEFGLVVPLLCLLMLVLVDFAKGMNYWLDLNHVAAEGARKAAVNYYATAGEYQTYVRDRLETTELRAGGTNSIPTGATVAICLPEGSDVGDPVTVQVAVGYRWIPFISSVDWNIKGTATMRLEQTASFGAVGTCT
jgi:Flp pilus assembly protein TadG